jgi:site-specific DNA-methyltransferase (adenine-specific)
MWPSTVSSVARRSVASRLVLASTSTRRFATAAPGALQQPTFRSHAASYTRGDAGDTQSYTRLFHASGAGATPRRVVDLLLTDPPYCLLTPRATAGGAATAAAATRAERQPSTRKKLSWDASGAVQRFDSVKAYREFTLRWLSAAAPWLHDDAVVIIWTNFLGKQPICEAMQQVLPQYRRWNEMLWLKPSKPEGKRAEAKSIQHSIAPLAPSASTIPNPIEDATAAHVHLSPQGHASLPPLALSLTSPEQTYRAYEVALVFGVGDWQQSNFAYEQQAGGGQLPPVQSVLCPFEMPSESTPTSSSRVASSTHPNAKPARVLLPLLSAYSKLDSLVLDPFAGSSAHVLTAMRAGRRVAAMELNAHWAQRMEEQIRARCECARTGEALKPDCMKCIERPVNG